jgi:hypothetical protein
MRHWMNDRDYGVIHPASDPPLRQCECSLRTDSSADQKNRNCSRQSSAFVRNRSKNSDEPHNPCRAACAGSRSKRVW